MPRIPRRTIVLAGVALLAAPLLSLAQQLPKVWRIGFLSNGTVASANFQLDALVRGLNELGYAEGRNFVVESRWAEGKLDRLPALVAELLAHKLDVVFAPSGVAAQAMKEPGTTIPIVFAFAPDPVGQGFGNSLSRPGGNMTGLTSTHTELSAKRMELLKEAFPATRRIAVLYFLAQSAAGVKEQIAETERAAKILGVTLVTEESPRVEDFERAFASIQKQRPDALIVIENPMFFTNRVRLTELAASLRIPAIYNVSENVHSGGLMSKRELFRSRKARRRVRGQDSQRRRARRPPDRATHQVRDGRQFEDGQSRRPHDSPGESAQTLHSMQASTGLI